MKETEKSLRAYFILVALVSGAINIAGLLRSPLGIGTLIILIGIGLSVAYFYLGLRLKHLLVASPGTITAVLIAGAVFEVAMAVIGVLTGVQSSVILQAAVGLLIIWYLYANTKRLAAQARLDGSSGT